jgi:phage terminase large subunit
VPEIALSYVPRPQFLAFHTRTKRFAVMLAHRQAGKTVACVNEAIHRAVYSKKERPRYAYIAPLRNQAKGLAWDYLKAYSDGLCDRISEAELSVQFKHNGARITLYGSDNPDAFRGLYFDGIILDEYGDMAPSTWTKILFPTLSSRKGWVVFIGTPKGKNHFYAMYTSHITDDNWWTYLLRASESNIYSAEDLAAFKKEMSEDEYLQEYECSFDAAVVGTYYSKLIDILENSRRVNAMCEYDPEFPVESVLDLGFTDSCAIWYWQTRPDGIAVIDYDEENGQPLPYYYDLLNEKGFKYETIWLPHDARAKTLQTGRSTLEQFLHHQFPVDIVPSLSLQHGIDAARFILPQCYFNPRCQPGLEALRAYRRKFNEKTKAFSDAPIHDWSSHGADAFRYLSLICKERIVPTASEAPPRPPRDIPPEPICLNGLWEEREDRLKIRRY